LSKQNHKALLEDIFFDPSFKRLREGKSKFKINPKYKKALEKSIKKGKQ
jgi:hypothetical protein